MKKLIYGGLFLAAVGITILACKKEVMNPSRSSALANNTTSTKAEKSDLFSSPTDKSTGNGTLDSMAQAANIAQIKYNSNGTYSIDSYDDTLTYNVLVTKFYEDSLVKFFISERTTVYTVLINVHNQTINISGVGSYTFSNYYDSLGITASSGIIKNMVAVFTPYYALYKNHTTSWTDNGDGDSSHPNAIFWGTVETGRGPCEYHLQQVYYSDYVFWIRVKKYSLPTPC